MFDGEPQDTPGECNCHLYLADNHGDNHITIRCQLPTNHTGPHCEWFYRGEGKVTITWEKDERAAVEAENAKFEEWEAAGCPDDWDWENAPP